MTKRIILEDKLGNQLHPMTLGKYVVTDSGETVDGLVSKTQMFSPIVTMDSSMNKVGVGNDIDVHSNIKDGAYEECMFEGRTLVNIASRVGEFSIVSTASNHGQKEIATNTLLKRNTKYLLALDYNVTFDDASTSKSFYLDAGHGYSYIGTQDNRVITSSNGTGHFVTTFTTKDEEKTINSNIHLTVFKGGDSKAIINNLVIVEYQDGMENWDIPYFTGICDSKMPILRNVGKNLVNPALFRFQDNLSGNGSEKVESVGDDIIFYGVAKGYYLDVILKENTSYYINYESRSDVANIRLFDLDGWQINNLVPNTLTTDIQQNTIVTTNKKCRLRVWTEESVAVIRKLMVAEVTQAIPYEPYKTNILQTSDEIVLRSVGNVKDTYNTLTGEYVKRIGEVVIDGSSDEIWGMNEVWSTGNICSFFNTTLVQPKGLGITSDKLPGKTRNELVQGEIAISEGIRSDVGNIQVFIDKSKLTTTNVDGFKLWLSQNPITIQYPLTTPITTIIKPSTIPFAYANGHVILESGYTGQSLLPTLKYSAVTGRTGQVTQNAKILHQQEKQIASLEDLLLTQIIQMDYERTLLQFDFELNTYGLN